MTQSPFAQMTSRLGPGLKFVLGAIAVVGLLEAVLVHWVGMPQVWNFLVCTPEGVLSGQLWRLITAGFLTDISHPLGLIFTLFGLYFLSPDLERRWGTSRFLWFLAASVVLGNVIAIGIDWLAPDSLRLLHPHMLFGAEAALVGTAIAWGVLNQAQQVLPLHDPPGDRPDAHLDHDRRLLPLSALPRRRGELRRRDHRTDDGRRAVAVAEDLPAAEARDAPPPDGGRVPTAYEIAKSKQPILRKRPPLRVVQGGSRREPREPRDKRYLN